MSRRVEVGGRAALTYFFHDVGTCADGRPPTLLLHPWFGCPQMWNPLAGRLDVPSYAADWYSLGAGGSAAWRRWASPAGLARAAIALLDDRRLEYVDVIGNSVGGIVAQILAAAYPERVRRLILIGTGAYLGDVPTEFGQLVSRWIAAPEQRSTLVAHLVDALIARPHQEHDRDEYIAAVNAANPDYLAHVLQQARQTDLRPRLGAIAAPTLVIRGEHDSARTPAHTADLVAGIPRAEAVEMAGCGHSPMVEDPDAVAMLVLDHLRQ